MLWITGVVLNIGFIENLWEIAYNLSFLHTPFHYLYTVSVLQIIKYYLLLLKEVILDDLQNYYSGAFKVWKSFPSNALFTVGDRYKSHGVRYGAYGDTQAQYYCLYPPRTVTQRASCLVSEYTSCCSTNLVFSSSM